MCMSVPRSLLLAMLFFQIFLLATLASVGGLVSQKQLTKLDGKITSKVIVGLRHGKTKEDVLDASAIGLVSNEWKKFNAFAVHKTDKVLEVLLEHEDVRYVEEEGFITLNGQVVETDGPWGLARLSAPGPLNTSDDSALNFSYAYEDSAGKDVTIYVIDTGIRLTHVEFEGRASWGASFPSGITEKDVAGHGTHIAATAAGRRFGVAKAANVVAVRVFDDNGIGNCTSFLSGMDWVLSAHQRSGNSSVVSMSLNCQPSTAIDDAVKALTDSGVHVVVAAGNFNVSASTESPSRAPEAITVGALAINDSRADFSNFGPAVDIFAPGVNITSASRDSDTATAVMTGTSMSTPHISGLVAYLISLEGDLPPAEMSQKVKNMSQKGLIQGLPSDTINAIAHNGQ